MVLSDLLKLQAILEDTLKKDYDPKLSYDLDWVVSEIERIESDKEGYGIS